MKNDLGSKQFFCKNFEGELLSDDFSLNIYQASFCKIDVNKIISYA